ncbi:exported hypothetical protein, partial [Gigaspora margarita]
MMRLKSSFVVLLFGFVSYSSLGFTQPEQSKVSESTVIQSLQSANLMPIPIGSLSTQDNARHQAYCKSIGANDVTNSGKVMVSSGISDLAVCLRNDVRKNNAAPPESNKIFRIDGNGGLLPLPPETGDRSKTQLTIIPHPATGSVPYGSQFYAAAYVDFFDIPRTGMGRAESSIPADDCRWAYQDLLQAGDARISGFT